MEERVQHLHHCCFSRVGVMSRVEKTRVLAIQTASSTSMQRHILAQRLKCEIAMSYTFPPLILSRRLESHTLSNSISTFGSALQSPRPRLSTPVTVTNCILVRALPPSQAELRLCETLELWIGYLQGGVSASSANNSFTI